MHWQLKIVWCVLTLQGKMPSEWSIAGFVRDKVDLSRRDAECLVVLFDEQNTVPFIARYRKNETGNLATEKIRSSFLVWQEAKAIKAKISSVKEKLELEGKANVQICALLDNAKSMEQIKELWAPLKGEIKQSLTLKAKAMGLEPLAMDIVAGREVQLNAFVDRSKGLNNIFEVEQGINYLIGDYLYHQVGTMKDTMAPWHQGMRELLEKQELDISLRSWKSKSADKMDSAKTRMFQHYFWFEKPLKGILPHQIMKLNRGEKNKILHVEIVVPKEGLAMFHKFVNSRYFGSVARRHQHWVCASIDDCYHRLIVPQLCRLVRSSLTKDAQQVSAKVFADNLRPLLLTPPVKDCAIIGIDPGFRHGCKCALINNSGQLMSRGTFWVPEWGGTKSLPLIEKFCKDASRAGFKEIRIPIGNGTGCRQTEALVSDFLKKLKSVAKVEYCIVNETGTSEYSVSELADKELPKLDPIYRSAVSIARRLQDPLAEYVKVNPKQLGIGMYQRDIKDDVMKQNLDLVVQECVSYVGVDINTCSVELLQHVAGMNRTLAANVDAYKKEHGPFTNRQQLLNVKGINKKVFQQCAGFVKIFPSRLAYEEPQRKKRKLSESNSSNPLDSTLVHPESYEFAKSLIQLVDCSLADVGTPRLIDALVALTGGVTQTKTTDHFTAQHVFESLTKPIHSDFREDFAGPIFRQSVRSFAVVRKGDVLNGVVCNVTPFGAFVDIGLEENGLIHISNLGHGRRLGQLQVGTRVVTEVVQVDRTRSRLGLRLDAIK